MTFLMNDLGRPFTDAGFGSKFRDWCDQADLPQCSAHGLRKAGATVAANNGATAHQLMAIFGWDALNEAEKYTAKADQQRLAQAAMHLLDKRQNREQRCPTFYGVGVPPFVSARTCWKILSGGAQGRN
jgi:site-specific recombinase XerD